VLRVRNASLVYLCLTVASGVAFLLDLLCVLWWYSRYIYVVQPTSTLSTHLLDFSVCAVFATAAVAWDKPDIFMWVTLVGTLLIGSRLLLLYRGEDSTDTDRLILRRAAFTLTIAASSGLIVLLGLDRVVEVPGLAEGENLLAFSPGAVSLLGVVLTWCMRDVLTTAGNIHECRRLRYSPMEIRWPDGLDDETKTRIRKKADAGLTDFQRTFKDQRLWLERLQSRVHSDADVLVQSFILGVSSQSLDWEDEVEDKAYMVGASHWCDDLVDGRREHAVLSALEHRGKPRLSVPSPNGLACGAEFERIYRREIIRYTSKRFYERLVEEMEKRVPVVANRDYLYFGFNRVAVGAVVFSPKVSRGRREAMLTAHNHAVLEAVSEEAAKELDPRKKDWLGRVRGLLADMNERESHGETLIGLTTKTVQELAMSSERGPMSFGLSILYSMLYAPLLYFHDIQNETDWGEMTPLDRFDVNYHLLTSNLCRCRDLCQEVTGGQYLSGDKRHEERMAQLLMAYRCFERKLPDNVATALEMIYLPEEQRNANVRRMRKGRGEP
jgi:hypothetical protein